MSLLEDLKDIVTAEPISLPFSTGHKDDVPPDAYVVAVPLADRYDLHADDTPGVDVQEVQLSLYVKGSYQGVKNAILAALIGGGYTITGRRFVGYEPDTGYNNYAIDVAHYYDVPERDENEQED